MSTFGLKLRELRQKAKLTQEQLAEKADISRITLARLETDVAVPSWPTVLSLAGALGVSVEVFPNVATALRETMKRPPPATSKRSARSKKS